MARSHKKVDKLEVRLSTETKLAFLTRCAAEGRSASAAMRAFIDEHLARPLNPKELPMTIVRSPFTYAGLAAVALSGFLAVSAPSQAGSKFEPIFKELDKNGDGRLTPAEFSGKTGAEGPPKAGGGQANLSANLRETDTNRDGAVSLAEFSAFNRASIIKRFLALDANSDGRVTLDELQRPGALLQETGSGFSITGSANGFLDKIDTNKDGAITESEFTALL